MNRFDLEQEIMRCWKITEDIEMFYGNFDHLDEDQQMNLLLGLKELYELRFQKLWNTFEECVSNEDLD